MRTKVLLVVAALLMAIVSTVAIGSNMGFKISIPLSTAGDGNNFVSIPYYWSAPTWTTLSDPSPSSITASDLIYDCNGAATLTECKQYNPLTGSYTIRRKTAAAWLGTDFAITAGTGYILKVPADVNYVCVGSHNPTLSISLSTAGDGNNVVSVPYHFSQNGWTNDPSASITASDIIYDANGAVTLTECKKYDPLTGSFTIRRKTAAAWLGTDFSVVPGQAYVVKVPADVSWTPSHY